MELAVRCAALRTAAARSDARAALWTVLHAALFAAARAQSRRLGGCRHEDLEDVASAKALELLLKAEEGTWDPAGRPEHEIAGYVTRVARNGLVDLARRRGREVPRPEDDDAWDCTVEIARPVVPSDEGLVASEFASALARCVAQLAPRARQVWFRRVFHEWSSREIATLIGVAPGHVDVIVSRARVALRSCMQLKGFQSDDVRPGVFANVWPIVEREWRERGDAGFEET